MILAKKNKNKKKMPFNLASSVALYVLDLRLCTFPRYATALWVYDLEFSTPYWSATSSLLHIKLFLEGGGQVFLPPSIHQ